MTLLSSSLPRVTDFERFYEDPLSFLAESRSTYGDIFVLRDGGPVFSRSEDCAGAVAVFGSANQRAVLSDIEVFALPVSAAEHLQLPATLVNLNRGLHSMRGEQHTVQQRTMLAVLSENAIEEQGGAVDDELESFMADIREGDTVPLLPSMRKLALQVSTSLLFGDYPERADLVRLLHLFFQARREGTSQRRSLSESGRNELIALGESSDQALRRFIGGGRRQTAATSEGLLTRLCRTAGNNLSDDELVAHCNVFFMSSNEPIAVSLTWILLILSQLPDLRWELRAEGGPSLQWVINEVLRLLTPNAMMVRVTTERAKLDGVELPECCELVLCPFLAHRDPDRFPQPERFLPQRWRNFKPSPFEYFPFGAGGHACVGQRLAMYLLKTVLSRLLQLDLVLDGNQEVDWGIDIMLTPVNDVMIKVREANSPIDDAGKLLGPVAELVRF